MNRFSAPLPIISDSISDAVSRDEVVALQTSYNKSVYVTFLEEYSMEDANKILRLAVDYTPGQLCGTGRQNIKHYEETQKTNCLRKTFT